MEKDEAEESILLFRADDPAALTKHLRQILSHKLKDYALIEHIVQDVPTLPEMRPIENYLPEFVERVAQQIRDWLGVGETCPLGDVLALLENKGLKVILHPMPTAVSGFSAFTETAGATIFINANHPSDRQFFTALHELAHLIFHRHEYHQPQQKVSRTDAKEKAANHFAGAVLLSEAILLQELQAYKNCWLPEPLLIDIKQRYSVSMRTVIYRAYQIGLISEKQRGQQIGQLNKKYGKESEPIELTIVNHLTRLERLVYLALIKEEITISRAAEILGQPLMEVRNALSQWLEEFQPCS